MPANKDRIINVPMSEDDISNTVSSLPRPENTSGVVAVKWKRKMAMKNHHMEQFINPDKLIKAVKKLKELGNPFYQDIEVNENFHQENEENKQDDASQDMESENVDPISEELANESDDQGEEETNMLHSVRMFQSEQNGNTCLMHQNPEEEIVENFTARPKLKKKKVKSTKSFEIAPGEGKTPTNWLREDNFDAKGFPTLYPTGKYGLHHDRNVKISAQKFFNQR